MKQKLKLVIEQDRHLFINRDIPLVDEEPLKKNSYIDNNVEPDLLRVAILSVQDRIIERVTGECLADQLRYLKNEGVICDNEWAWYKRLLDDYLFKIFVYGVPVELSIPGSFKDRNAGRVRHTDEDYQVSALNEIKYSNQWYLDRMDTYISRAVDFLRCNKEHFCELCGCFCGCGCKVSPFNKDFSFGINLSPVYNKYKRRRYGY